MVTFVLRNLIQQSFLTLLIIESITLVAIVISIFLRNKIPVREFNLVIYCLLSEFFGYISYSVTYFLSTTSHIDDFSSDFSGLGYFLSITSIMFVTYALMFIDFRGSDQQILELIFLTWIGGVTAVYNGVTFHAELSEGSIQIIYNPLGILFVGVFFGLVIYFWVKRFRQISKIYRLQNAGKNVSKELSVFILLGCLLIIIYIIFVIFLNLHGDYSFIAGGILTIIGIAFLITNNAFLFVTDIKLDSIIIIEKQSGLRLFSKEFNNDLNDMTDEEGLDTSDFISSVISTINVSLSKTIRSHKDLTEMAFSNKTVIIYSGEVVRSILIVSDSNVITKGISRYIVKKFEKKFGKTIEEKFNNGVFISRISDYIDFEKEISYIREFIPL